MNTANDTNILCAVQQSSPPILRLPSELLLRIAYFVSLKDPAPRPPPGTLPVYQASASSLLALSLSCRDFLCLSQYYLFKDLKFTGEASSSCAKVSSFFDFILDRPDLALRIHSLSLDLYNREFFQPEFTIDPTIYSSALAMISQTTLVPSRKKLWICDLKDVRFSALLIWGLIMMKLRNLDTLKIHTSDPPSTPEFDPEFFNAHPLAYMAGGWYVMKYGPMGPKPYLGETRNKSLIPSLQGLGSLVGLASLRTLDITVHENFRMIGLELLPNITTLSVKFLDTLMGMYLGGVRKPSDVPDFQNIKHLRINSRTWGPRGVDAHNVEKHTIYNLRLFPRLKGLEFFSEPAGFDWTAPYGYWETEQRWQEYEPGEQCLRLIKALEPLYGKLEVLTMPGGPWALLEDGRFKTNFTVFKQLRRLTVAHAAIVELRPEPTDELEEEGIADVNPPKVILGPLDLLPQTLEFLCVFDAVEATIAWLAGIFRYGMKHFPELVTVEVVLRHGQDLGLLTEVVEFMAAGSGISVSVLMEDLEDWE